MESDLLRIFEALERAGAKYLVVGGVAVVLHGYLRVTADVNLVVKLESSNALVTMNALAHLGFKPRAPVPIEQFADAAARATWITEKGLTVFSLWSPKMPGAEIDIFVEEPFDFDATYARAVRANIEGVAVTVVALDDLIALKRTAGRAKDEEDIRELLALKKRRAMRDQSGWKDHEREQLRARLRLTYAERLRWLEQAKRFARVALGAAKHGTLVR